MFESASIMSRTRSAGAERECAACSASSHCWDGRPTRGSGLTIDRSILLERGSTLFMQGERFDGIYVVASGCLKLRELRADGTERIIAFRTPGELVGLEGWVSGQHPHAAIAANRTKVCRIKTTRGGRIAGSELLECLLRKAAVQLERAASSWVSLPATERVAAFLEDFAKRMRQQDIVNDDSNLPMTRAEIGSHLGLAEETVVRALAKLRSRRQAVTDSH